MCPTYQHSVGKCHFVIIEPLMWERDSMNLRPFLSFLPGTHKLVGETDMYTTGPDMQNVLRASRDG